ncbi:LOW QUALITY PROTEIN: glutamate receptor ionotropic, kainate 2-like [Lethenteron reissneri]|uniref:LOW QUALITY PROTEIN: glutamate receptor ionotropic, kainate 2-like n=1 Tax=Lethenteron reissneri TaxID=7753 RepID=UPI002AB6AB10|nr:LOW QUALITY PROTEIN: glutamate receptor ionotropic, kainate 2-like [Lethenteron reissneri]
MRTLLEAPVQVPVGAPGRAPGRAPAVGSASLGLFLPLLLAAALRPATPCGTVGISFLGASRCELALLNSLPWEDVSLKHIQLNYSHGEIAVPDAWPKDRPVIVVSGEEDEEADGDDPPIYSHGPPLLRVNARSVRDASESGLQLAPRASALLGTAAEIAIHLRWDGVILLYDHGKHVDVGFVEKLQLSTRVVTMRLSPPGSPELRTLLERVRQERVRNIIIKCRRSWLRDIFIEADEFGLTSPVYHWVLPMLESNPRWLLQLPLSWGWARATVMRVLGTAGGQPCSTPGAAEACATTCLLLHDAAVFLAAPKGRGGCSAEALEGRVVQGLTGPVQFAPDGFRKDVHFSLYSLELGRNDSREVRVGDHRAGRTSFTAELQTLPSPSVFKGRIVRVIAVEEPPLFGCVPGCARPCSPACGRFQGFLYELLKDLSLKLNFRYVISNVTSGIQDKDVMQDIQKKLTKNEADFTLCLCPVRGNQENRELEFSFPLMDRGYQMLIRKPERELSGAFEFLNPFHVLVWLSILLACIVVAFVLAAINRFDPYEWRNLAKRGKVSREEGRGMDLLNCLGFTLVSMVQQSVSVVPRSYAGKIVAFSWWFFVLVTISTYTANLAAIFQSQNSPKLESLADLVDQNDFKYNTYHGYPLVEFLRGARSQPFQAIWEHIEQNSKNDPKPHLLSSEEEGLQMVGNSSFVFLGSSAAVYRATTTNCTLQVAGELFFKSKTALMFPRGSVLREPVSRALIALQREGRLEELEEEWLEAKGPHCEGKDSGSEKTVDVNDTEGIFYLLCIGLSLGFMVSTLEVACHRALRDKKKRNHSMHAGKQPSM